MFKKLLSLALASLMLILAVSCAKPDNPETQTTAADAQTTESQTVDTTPENEVDSLPEVKFNNATYTILSRKNTVYEVSAEEISGDIVKDAVFQRNSTVEDRFGVKIVVETEPGEWGNRATFVQKVANEYMGGTAGCYDLIMTHSAYIVDIGIAGYAYNMNDLENIDFSKKWWCPAYTANVDIDGFVFSAIGDLTYSLYERLQCMFFNKSIFAANNLPDLYELVASKEWTFDKMKEIALSVGSDLNGDGKYDADDLYGIGLNNHTCRIFQTTFDTKMTVADGEGRQKINLPNEKYTNVYTDVYNFIKGNTQVRWDGEADSQVTLFMNDKLAMFAGRLGNAVTMKEMEHEYGIVPFPLYNADQTDYISGARDYMTAMAIFGKLDNPEKTGVVTEALCMYGYKMITPAYYETSLKFKYISDPIAMSMLDIIRDHLTFDFAMTFTAQIQTFFSIMGDNIANSDPNIANYCKGKQKGWGIDMDKIYAAYEKLK